MTRETILKTVKRRLPTSVSIARDRYLKTKGKRPLYASIQANILGICFMKYRKTFSTKETHQANKEFNNNRIGYIFAIPSFLKR